MKRKYYLRGIGVGILFATIVFLTAYMVTGQGKLSQEEIIRQAEALGMVQQETTSELPDKPSEKTDEQPDTETDSTDDRTATEKAASTENSEATQAVSEAQTTESASSEATTESASSEQTADARVVTFTVVSGMNSWNVATILQDQGVIESADEFDSYLEANGYSSRIVTGEYSVAIGTDYESIAHMITGQ
jgi:hypothetical protein